MHTLIYITDLPHAMDIKLKSTQKIKILNGHDVFKIMQQVLLRDNKIERDKEHFWIVGLNADNIVLFVELVSLGGRLSTVVEPISVFRVAVIKNAVSAIFVHNHPSQALAPSQADKDLTDRLIQVGRIIDVNVLDHLVISTKSYFSFDDMGLMEELRKSLTWIPPYEIEQKIRQEEQRIRQIAMKNAKKEGKQEGIKKGIAKGILAGKEEGIQEGLIVGESRGMEKGLKEGIAIGENRGIEKGKIEGQKEMARGLKARGIDPAIIAETSGLSISDIEKL